MPDGNIAERVLFCTDCGSECVHGRRQHQTKAYQKSKHPFLALVLKDMPLKGAYNLIFHMKNIVNSDFILCK